MSLEVNLNVSFDELLEEPIVLPLFEERVPLHGYPGIVDWELCGHLSKMIAENRFEGKERAKLLIYLDQECRYNKKVLVYGLGKKHMLTPKKLSLLTEDLMVTLSKLCLYNVVYVLPSLYDANFDIKGLLEGITCTILKFTSKQNTVYKFRLMWEGVSKSDIVNSFKFAIGIIPDASLSIIERED